MQAVRFLHKAFSQALPTIHSKRLNALMSCVSALLHGHRLTLTDLGRAMPSEAYTQQMRSAEFPARESDIPG